MKDKKEFVQNQKVREALRKAVPAGRDIYGKIGNEPVFQLCQYLAGVVPEDTSSDDLHGVVMQWYEISRKHLRRSFMEIWITFCDLWDEKKIRYPKKDTLNAAIARAELSDKDLPELSVLVHDSLKLLGHVLYELQQIAINEGRENFFISGEDAGHILNSDQRTGCRALKRLVKKGIIELIEKGHTGHASEYRYKASKTLNDVKFIKKRDNMKKQLLKSV